MNSQAKQEARSVIDAFHRTLNAPGSLPGKAYRRNVRHYELVSYVNNITGLFLSGNYAVVPLFIGRAYEHMRAHQPDEGYSSYFRLVDLYLKQLLYFFREVLNEDIVHRDLIPSDALAAGPQCVPDPPQNGVAT